MRSDSIEARGVSEPAERGPGPLASPAAERIDYLDATRAFALLLGIVFHASLSFMPTFIGWAVQDVSTSPWVAGFVLVSHSFRMEVFFLLSGFLGYRVLQSRGLSSFVRTRAVRILVPFAIGWFLLRPLIVSGWVMGAASLRGDVDVGAGLRTGFASLQTLPAGIFTGSHLWFLYYLALVTAGALVVRAVLGASGAVGARVVHVAEAGIAWLVTSRWKLAILVPPTASVLYFMQQWGMDTPDQSLVPHLPVLAIYAGFFGFGWVVARRAGLMDLMARPSWAVAVGAGAGLAVTLSLIGYQFQPGHPRFHQVHLGFVAGYALMMWCLVLLCLGWCRKFCEFAARRSPSAGSGLRGLVRYVADASYWLYLLHLPVVVWAQVAVAELPLHWSLKLAGISLGTILVLLASYDACVRSTVIGQVLNGRRKPRVFFAAPRVPSVVNP